PPDVASYLWGHVVGSSRAVAEKRQPGGRLDYRHVEALKVTRVELSEQVLRLQQQLSAALQTIRRAASEEFYAPHHQQSFAFQSPPRRVVTNEMGVSMAVPMTAIKVQSISPKDEPTMPDGTGVGEPRTPSPAHPVLHHVMGEGDPKKPYFREGALRYPLSM